MKSFDVYGKDENYLLHTILPYLEYLHNSKYGVGHKHGKVWKLMALVTFLESTHKLCLNILNFWILFNSMINN